MTHQEILFKIDWEVKKQERFLNLVGRANRMKSKDRDVVLKNALWVDGTYEPYKNTEIGKTVPMLNF